MFRPAGSELMEDGASILRALGYFAREGLPGRSGQGRRAGKEHVKDQETVG
jgi:hypothetical protein